MHFTASRRLEHGIIEREFTLGDVPGILWTPESAVPAPLILVGHPGGLEAMRPRVLARAAAAVAAGFAAATLEVPGAGVRPPAPEAAEARLELREAIIAGGRPSEEVIERLILPLVDQAVPEWQATLDALLAFPEVCGPVGWSGGLLGIGIRLAAVEPRVVATSLFAGSYVPRSMLEEARGVTIPVHILLQWDDVENDRQLALDLYDAFGSQEKTLYASLGGHTGVPPWAAEDAGRFFERHLR